MMELFSQFHFTQLQSKSQKKLKYMNELNLDTKIFLYMLGTGVLLYFWRREKNVEQYIAEVLTVIAMLLVGIFCTLVFSTFIKA